MKNHFLALSLVYAYVVLLLVIAFAIPLDEKADTLLSLTLFIGASVVHTVIAIRINARKENKRFFFLSLLWGANLVFFSVCEGLYFFFQISSSVLGGIWIFLFSTILLLVSISFLVKTPFWYMKTENKISIAIGIPILIISGLLTVILVVGLILEVTFRASDIFPAWCPDGKRIAFTSDRAGNLDIWIMDSDGENLKQLTTR